jgi:hypothetical protein
MTIHLRLNSLTNGLTLESSQNYIMTDGQSASLSWNEAQSGAYDQIFVTFRQLRVCLCGALSL